MEGGLAEIKIRPVRDHLFTGLVLFLYGLVATVGVFSGGLWGGVGIVGGIVLFLGCWYANKKRPQISKDVSIFLALVMGAFALELPIAEHAEISLHFWVRLLSVFVPLVLWLSPDLQRRAYNSALPTVIACAASVGAVALGAELLSGGVILHFVKKEGTSLTEYNRGVAHLVILAFPLLAGLWVTGKKRAAILFCIVLLFPASLTDSRTAKLALVAGLAVTVVAQFLPLLVSRLLTVVPFALVSWPVAASWVFAAHKDILARLPDSWHMRVEIWDYLSYRIRERPFLGWGLGNTHLLDFQSPHGADYIFVVGAAPHAHNFITQVWVETGVAGLALCVLFLLLTLKKASNMPPELKPFAFGCWLAAVTVSLVGFDFWTDALWAAFTLSAFLFGGLAQQVALKTRTYGQG